MSSLQPAGEFAMPMGFKDIDKFETLNDVEVNVFGFEKRDLFPMRVSKVTTSELSFDLLLLYENDKHHYVLIKNLCRLLCFIKIVKFIYAGTVFTFVRGMLNNLKIMLNLR